MKSSFNHNALLIRAAEDGDIKSIQRCLDVVTDHHAVNRAFMQAAVLGHLDVMDVLKEKGANINWQNDRGMNALMWSAGKGQFAAVQKLVSYGANLDLKDGSGRTALFGAVLLSCPKTTRCLLENGAGMFVKDDEGKTVVEAAQKKGNAEIIALLEEFDPTSPFLKHPVEICYALKKKPRLK